MDNAVSQAEPRFVLVLAEGLPINAMTSDAYPALRRFAQNGAVGLMNTAVNGAKTDANALQTLATGRRDFLPSPTIPDDSRLAALLHSACSIPFAALRADAPERMAADARHSAGCLLVHLPDDPDALNRFLDALCRDDFLSRARVLVAAARPVVEKEGEWRRLAPVLYAGEGVVPGLLSSATTRTPGLLTNVDIAPTLSAAFSVPAPPLLLGRPLQRIASPNPFAVLSRLDRRTRVHAEALVPVFGSLFTATLLVFGKAFFALVRWGGKSAQRFPSLAFGVLVLMNMPLALLLVPLFAPVNAVIYVLLTGGVLFVCTGVEFGIAKRMPAAPLAETPFLCALLTLAVLVGDLLNGQTLMRDSLLGADALTGIRYYGIGNEYTGVLIGTALLTAFWRRPSALAAALCFIALSVLVGLPGLGAKAGGIVVCAVAFGVGGMRLWGRTIRGRHALGWTLFGVGAMFLTAWLDRHFSGGAATHLGGALQAAESQGGGALWRIILRKAAMNGSLILHPVTLGLLALVGLAVWLVRGSLRTRWLALTAAYPAWYTGLPAFYYGSLTMLLFNDSGVVGALFLFGAFFVSGLILCLDFAPRFG